MTTQGVTQRGKLRRKCQRCGWEWYKQERTQRVRICPRCKSRLWNVKPKNGTAETQPAA